MFECNVKCLEIILDDFRQTNNESESGDFSRKAARNARNNFKMSDQTIQCDKCLKFCANEMEYTEHLREKHLLKCKMCNYDTIYETKLRYEIIFFKDKEDFFQLLIL